MKPKQKYAEKPKIPLPPPIGDSCSCSKVYIEPVALPTPLPKASTYYSLTYTVSPKYLFFFGKCFTKTTEYFFKLLFLI